jgi:LmbE family N-acetylglucosaminyl deacetylase
METLDRLIEQGVRMLWVAAHPDDECFTAGILAKQTLRCHQPLHLLVLTEGEGGSFPKKLQDGRPLNEVRRGEMEAVARGYGATLEMERFWNAPLPVASFPYRHEIARKWAAYKDPARVVAETIRRFRPDVLLTFAPEHGATGHPEHQLASRFAGAGIRLAASDDPGLPGEPHRVAHTYFLVFRYKLLGRLGMKLDPREPTEVFDTRQPCVDGKTCGQVMCDLTRHHRTQDADMSSVRLVMRFARWSYLHATDPFTEIYDPYEEHLVRGMG